MREVPVGYAIDYAVDWSGLVDDPRCYPAPCPRPLGPGRYLLSARAEEATSGDQHVVTAWLDLT